MEVVTIVSSFPGENKFGPELCCCYANIYIYIYIKKPTKTKQSLEIS